MSKDKVLIVEDEVGIVGKTIEEFLCLQGYDIVGIAETRNIAVKLAIQHKPHAILMDIALIDENGESDYFGGIEAAQEILNKIQTQIIFLTGCFQDNKLMQKVREVKDSFTFLVKPFNEEQLAATAKLAVARNKELIRITEEEKIVSLLGKYRNMSLPELSLNTRITPSELAPLLASLIEKKRIRERTRPSSQEQSFEIK